MISIYERIKKYSLQKPNGCIAWTGSLSGHGGAVIFYNKRSQSVARVLYELNFGEIPKGVMVKRKCRDIKCVNPDHLELYDPADVQARLLSFVSKSTSGCWNWTGSKNPDGYGKTHFNGSDLRAHRLSYEHYIGPIPEGMLVRHKCDNPSCINPDHLEIGTTQDNVNDRCLRKRSRVLRGENVKTSKLTAALVREILTSELSGPKMAKKLGVARQTIDRIRRGESWEDVYREVKVNG